MKHSKLKLCTVSLILLLTTSATAQNNAQFNTTTFRSAFAFEQLTFSTVALAFTAATYAPTITDQPAAFSHADYAQISCTDNGQAAPNNLMRYRMDGTNPTASVGTTMGPNVSGGMAGVLEIWGFSNISKFRGIRLGTTDVVCGVHYFRQSSNIP